MWKWETNGLLSAYACVCVLSKVEDVWIHEEVVSGWFVSLYCYLKDVLE